MNDIEKAIEMIDKVWHPGKYSNEADNELHVDADELDKACELATIALEKQIPYEVDCRDVVNIRWTDGYCKCGRYVTDSMSCCINCGQKLDWEAENED